MLSPSCLQNNCQIFSCEVCIPGREEREETEAQCGHQENRVFLGSFFLRVTGQNWVTWPLLPTGETTAIFRKGEPLDAKLRFVHLEALGCLWWLLSLGKELLISFGLEEGTGLLWMQKEIPGVTCLSGVLVFFCQPEVLLCLFPSCCLCSFLVGFYCDWLQTCSQNCLRAHPEPVVLPGFQTIVLSSVSATTNTFWISPVTVSSVKSNFRGSFRDWNVPIGQ